MVLLIHSNVVEPKLGFERGFVAGVKDRAWFGTADEFGRFWAARNAAGVDVARSGEQRVVTVTLPAAIDGLTVSTPARWHFVRVEPAGVVATGPGRVTLASAVNRVRLVFASAEACSARPATRCANCVALQCVADGAPPARAR
jgi:hypothetical protein